MVKSPATLDPSCSTPASYRSGGPAASGGFNFQAAVTTIAGAHALAGAPLGWLEGIFFDAPIVLAAETGSGGDDLRLNFPDGSVADVQVKKGLRARGELTDAINALVVFIAANIVNYGVLALDPESSRSIRVDFSRDIRRLAEVPTASVVNLADGLRERILARGLDVQSICGRLRIITIPALDGNDAAVRTAMAHLSRVCQRTGDAVNAWDRLYRDAHLMMAQRGVRTRASLIGVLRSANIALSDEPSHGPAAVLTRLCNWILATTAQFSILGVAKPLPIDDAWLPLTAVVRDLTVATPETLQAALVSYHESSVKKKEETEFDSTTISRFRRLTVVVGGPGSGKTILLKRLARAYAEDGYPVLRVNARAVMRRMSHHGEGFLTAAFELGLDGSGLSPALARAANFGNWVLLCDGLDECGAQQQEIAEGLLQAASGDPTMRIVATTRPIGYRPATLSVWRHYDLTMSARDTVQMVAKILTYILPVQSQNNLYLRVKEVFKEGDAERTASRSPLLLGLCAALFGHGLPLGRTRPQFYRAIFTLIETEPPPRALSRPTTVVVCNRFLDILGWTLIQKPHTSVNEAIVACSSILGVELAISPLKARDLAETCLAWWQALGMVEELHYAGEPVLTFVHKTFGEFAAGRYLSYASEHEQKQFIESETDTSYLKEVINFASALGAAPVFLDDLIRRGFDGPQGQERLLQAIDMIGEARPALDDVRIDSIVAVAVSRMASAHRSWALQTGSVLADIAPVVAARITPLLPPLCSSEQLWTRLSAWALRILIEEQLDLDGLTNILRQFSGTDTREALSTLDGAIIIGRHSGRDLSDRMVLRVGERVFRERSTDESKAWIEGIQGLVWSGSAGLFISLQEMVRRYGLVLPDPPWVTSIGTAAKLAESDRLFRAAIQVLLATIGSGGTWQGPTGRTLYHLAAFFRLIGLLDQPLSEIWAWQHPFDQSSIMVVFRAFAALANIRVDALINDAATMLHDMSEDEDMHDSRKLTFFDRIPNVDVEDVDNRRDITLEIDFQAVEHALYHPSAAAVLPALHVAFAVGIIDDWRRVAARLLADGKGNSLWAATEMTKRLPRDEGLLLLLNHAALHARPGTTYVLETLKDLGVDDHPMREEALRSALFGARVDAAIAAANWLKMVPNRKADERPLVQAAFDYWLKHEGPYPTKGGTVPPSPRESLTHTLYQLGALDLSALQCLSEDSRPDVVNAARAGIIDLIAKDAGARSQFVELAQAGAVAPATLRVIFKMTDVFTAKEIKNLLMLLDSDNDRIRFAAMAILDWPSLDQDTRDRILSSLQSDVVPDIRERAIRMAG